MSLFVDVVVVVLAFVVVVVEDDDDDRLISILFSAVHMDFGLDTPDPGLAPDGAKCGDKKDKICVNQKCVPLTSLNTGAIEALVNQVK